MSCPQPTPQPTPPADAVALAEIEAAGFAGGCAAYPAEYPAAGSPRILIAEDDLETSQFLRIQVAVAAREFDVDFANDGAAALALYEAAVAQGRPYALLVLDVMMPVMTGFAVAEAIRESGDAATRIVFLTANAEPFSQARAALVKALGYWAKPGAIGDLPQRIRQVLAEHPTP